MSLEARLGPAVIQAAGLSKTYSVHNKEPGLRGSLRSLVRRRITEKHAVTDVSFSIASGEMVGFLGPNGAGKTTTLKMLCGLLYPTSGEAMVLGHTPSRRAPGYLRQIALVMGLKNMLWWDLPAMETLLMHKEIYDIPADQFNTSVRELSRMLEVEHLLKVQVRKLSLGERMKMELLTALVHSPSVLFLDEPTIGLDVVSQQRVREFLRRLNRERGTTMLLTSHYMDDIEALCPRVIVIDHGRIRFDGSLPDLAQRTAPEKIITAVFREPVELQPSDAPGKILSDGDNVSTSVRLSVERESVPACVSALTQLGTLVDLSVENVAIEVVVRDLFRSGTPGEVMEEKV